MKENLSDIELPADEPDGRFFTRVDWISFWSTFLASFLAYYFTLQPTVGLEDSGELAVAADYMGVPHPPGYPIWTLLAWFFQWILHGVTYNGHANPAFGVALMSAFFGALACGLVGMLITSSGGHLVRSLDRKKQNSIFTDWKYPAIGFGVAVVAGFLGLWVVLPALSYLGLSFTWNYFKESKGAGAYGKYLIDTRQIGQSLYGFFLGLFFVICLWAGNGLRENPADLNVAFYLALVLIASIPFWDWLMGRAQHAKSPMTPTARNLLTWAPGFACGMLLAFSPVMWSQAVIVEVYALNAFFMAVILLLTYMWVCRPDNLKLLYIASFMFGLGLTNHQSLLFLMLFLLVAIGMRRRDLFAHALALVFMGGAVLFFIKSGQYGLEAQSPETDMIARLKALKAQNFFRGGGALLITAPALFFALKKRWVSLVTIVVIFLGVLSIASITLVGAKFGATIPTAFVESVKQKKIVFGVIGVIAFLAPLALHFTHPKSFAVWRRLYLMFVLVVLGLSFHLYMPIASEQNPPMNWGYPRTPQGFKHALGRGQYEKIPVFKNLFGTIDQLRVKIPDQMIPRSGDDEIDRARMARQVQAYQANQFFFFRQMGAYFYNPESVYSMPRHFSVALSLIGLLPLLLMVRMGWHERTWMTCTCYAMVSLTVLFLIAQFPQLDKQDLFIKRVQYIQAHALFCVWIAWGLILLGYILTRLLPRLPMAGASALAMILFIPYVPLWKNANDREQIETLGSCEMNGHDFGWQFGYYQIMGAKGIIEEMGPDDPPLPNPDYPPEMEPNAIFYGGTDPGRFVPTYMLYSANVRPDIHLITQNALADNTYMNIMRDLYGNRIWIPSLNDTNEAFRQYVADYRSGKYTGGDVDLSGGKVSVQGVQNVMHINAILCEQMHEHNRDKHAFYVEESYVIPWMYPYLTPHGLIMKLHAKPVGRFDPKLIQDDFYFWEWYVNKLVNTPAFHRDIIAQKTFSKLRGSIAGLYAAKGQLAQAEQAFLQSIKLYPLSPEANFKLAEMYRQRQRYEDAQDLMRQLLELDPDNIKAAQFVSSMDLAMELDVRRKELEALVKRPPLNLRTAYDLMDVYRRLRQPRKIDVLGNRLLTNPSFTPPVYLQLAVAFENNGRATIARKALDMYLAKEKGDYNVHIQSAAIYIREYKPTEALKELITAIQLGKEPARQKIMVDERFLSLRKSPTWKKLMGLGGGGGTSKPKFGLR